MNYTQLDFTKLKPCGYCRKSSEGEDKQVLSIVSQIDELERMSNYHKLPTFVSIYKESKSAKLEGVRPEFQKIIDGIKSKKIDSIVCWKLDRLARNMTEGGVLIDLLSSGLLKAIITHDKVYYPADNVLLMSVEFGQGKQFVKELSVNVKRGQTKKALMGLPHGVATLGFLNDKTEEKGNRKWLVDKPRLDMIKILLDRFLTGTYSAGKLHRYATETLKLTTVRRKRCGGMEITPSRIYEILKDPVYAGFFYYGGERYELDPTLPRLITESEHNKVKALLTNANIPKVQRHNTTYSGLITSDKGEFVGQDVKYQVICDCKYKFAYRSKIKCPKCGIVISEMQNPKYLPYIHYYNVKKKKSHVPYKSISEDKIDNEVISKLVNNLTFSPDLVEWSRKYINEMKDKEVGTSLVINQRKDERKKELEDKKAKTRNLLRDGAITKDEYDQDIKSLEIEYSDTKQATVAIDWYSRLMQITDITSSIAKVMNSKDTEAKRRMISALGSNLIWNDEILSIINTKEVDALIEGAKKIRITYPEFEPKNYVMNKGSKEKTEPLDPVFSIMLRG